MQHHTSQLSTGKRVAVVGAFTILSVISLAWFVASAVNVWNQINSTAAVITLEKGALYLFGAGFALAVLTYAMVYEGILRRPLTKSVARLFSSLLIGSLLLTFGLPPVAGHVVDETLEARGYQVCDLKSRQWPIFRDVVYAATAGLCEAMLRDNKIYRAWPL